MSAYLEAVQQAREHRDQTTQASEGILRLRRQEKAFDAARKIVAADQAGAGAWTSEGERVMRAMTEALDDLGEALRDVDNDG